MHIYLPHLRQVSATSLYLKFRSFQILNKILQIYLQQNIHPHITSLMFNIHTFICTPTFIYTIKANSIHNFIQYNINSASQKRSFEIQIESERVLPTTTQLCHFVRYPLKPLGRIFFKQHQNFDQSKTTDLFKKFGMFFSVTLNP